MSMLPLARISRVLVGGDVVADPQEHRTVESDAVGVLGEDLADRNDARCVGIARRQSEVALGEPGGARLDQVEVLVEVGGTRRTVSRMLPLTACANSSRR